MRQPFLVGHSNSCKSQHRISFQKWDHTLVDRVLTSSSCSLLPSAAPPAEPILAYPSQYPMAHSEHLVPNPFSLPAVLKFFLSATFLYNGLNQPSFQKFCCFFPHNSSLSLRWINKFLGTQITHIQVGGGHVQSIQASLSSVSLINAQNRVGTRGTPLLAFHTLSHLSFILCPSTEAPCFLQSSAVGNGLRGDKATAGSSAQQAGLLESPQNCGISTYRFQKQLYLQRWTNDTVGTKPIHECCYSLNLMFFRVPVFSEFEVPLVVIFRFTHYSTLQTASSSPRYHPIILHLLHIFQPFLHIVKDNVVLQYRPAQPCYKRELQLNSAGTEL